MRTRIEPASNEAVTLLLAVSAVYVRVQQFLIKGIQRMEKEALLYEKLTDDMVHCYLCAHHCKIKSSKFGFCGVRQNRQGVLYTKAYGEVIAHNIDPIEKKPLHHFLPGTITYSIATIGCNFRCEFCQNWQISQENFRKNERFGELMTPEAIVTNAIKSNCKSISYTYTEPTIFFEYAFDTAKIAKTKNLYNVFVTNGFMTKDTINVITPYLDACNIDLKSFNNDFYKNVCSASLDPVLESIQLLHEQGIWIEITTLLIPGRNDSDSEIEDIAAFISSIDPHIPWHISRFFPQYKFHSYGATPIQTLYRAKAIAQENGLKNIHLGNI